MDNKKEFEYDSECVLQQWYRRIREAQFGHNCAYFKYKKLYYSFGIPSVIFSVFIGTALFSAISISTAVEIKFLIGFISSISAILAGLQTFLRFTEKANNHKKSARRYGELRREIEILTAKTKNADEITLDIIKSRIDDLSEDSLPIPESCWEKVGKKLKNDPSSFEILAENK